LGKKNQFYNELILKIKDLSGRTIMLVIVEKSSISVVTILGWDGSEVMRISERDFRELARARCK